MKNLIKSNKSIHDAYTEVAKGLHSPKKEFWTANEAILKSAFSAYESKAQQGKLIELVPLWSEDDKTTYKIKIAGKTKRITKSHRDLSREIYGSSRTFVNELWQELKLLNSRHPNRREEIICPICELRHCNQMDHHAPRALDKFPEYSACYSNLIPLCDDCNELKHDHWTEDEDGIEKRLWFNPYFDSLPHFDIFVSCIEISDGLPRINVKLNSLMDRNNEVHDVIFRTNKRLGLANRYEVQINIELTSFNERRRIDFEQNKTRYSDENDYVNAQYSLIHQLLSEGTTQTLVETMMYKAIISSEEYKDWLINELVNIK